MLTFEEYRRYDAIGLTDLVARGEVSPTELLNSAIARRNVIDPQINALSQRHDDEARRAIAAGLPDGQLKGVPFLLKDVSVQMAGTVTSNCSKLFADVVATQDSTIVERYRQAGLVIFGKTNTPEMGLAASTETAMYGVTRNPWNLLRTAGGSSGGAAAAVSAGARGLSRWRNVAGHGVCAVAKKVLFHLACQVLAGTRIGQVQSIFVHQHGLLLHPLGPGCLADFFPDALAQRAGVRG